MIHVYPPPQGAFRLKDGTRAGPFTYLPAGGEAEPAGDEPNALLYV